MEVDRCRDLRDHFPAFVTDALDPTIQARIREHLSLGCATCARDIGRLDEAFYALPGDLPPQGFLVGGAEAMVKAISRKPQEQPEEPILFPDGKPLRVAWTTAALFALALGAAAVWGRGMLDDVERAKHSVVAQQRQTRSVIDDYRSLEGAHDQLRGMLDSLTSADTRVVELAGEGTGRAFVSSDAVLLSFGPLPTGAAYEVALGEQVLGPIEARLAEAGGGRRYPLPANTDLTAAVVVRPVGGAPILSSSN